jgi:hypothetical protein
MPKVALYARYSTDNQSVASIEDQFRICREHAGKERWQVVDTYHDAAISGASVILRPGVQSLLQDAQRGSAFPLRMALYPENTGTPFSATRTPPDGQGSPSVRGGLQKPRKVGRTAGLPVGNVPSAVLRP